MTKIQINNILRDMTAEEQAEYDARQVTHPTAFEQSMINLRLKRNNLLKDTDYFALSDQTLSDDMRTYRQDLRDITEGLTTVEEVDAVVFPTKP